MLADASINPPNGVPPDWAGAKDVADRLIALGDAGGWSAEAKLRIFDDSPYFDVKLGYDATVKACIGGNDVGCHNQGALIEGGKIDRPLEEAVTAYELACVKHE